MLLKATWDAIPEGWRLRYGASESLPFSITLLGRGPLQDRAAGAPGITWEHLSAPGERLVAPHQVHGTAVIPGRSIWSIPCRPRADGVLLEKPDIWGSLRFADCYPVVVGGFFPHPWLLLLHSGYGGTVRDIVRHSLARVKKAWGAEALRQAVAWVGPGIGFCCYVRRRDDAATLRGCAVLPPVEWREEGEFVRFNLARSLKRQLVESGIEDHSICTLSLCTLDHADRLYSFRGGDLHARNFLFASIVQK